MENTNKTYTAAEIRKIAPGYRGKPENFNPDRLKDPKAKPQKQRAGPASPLVTPPTNLEKAKTPTPPKNNPMWADSVFGIDVSVRELRVNEEHTPTLARSDAIVDEVYSSLAADDNSLNKNISRNMLMYYTTAIAWTRLLDIKQKRAQNELTDSERSYLRAMTQQEVNVPQPIYLLLKGVGHVKEASGKTVYLSDHTLPREVVGGKGGYHSKQIDDSSHNLFEELPSLGICGDVLMAEAEQNETPNFAVLPVNTKATKNLSGFNGRVPKVKEEIVIALESIGIFANTFKEVIPGTRLNLQLVQRVSDYFATSKTFRIEKVKIDALTADGDAAQLVQTIPTAENADPQARWIDLVVKPYSANANTVSTIGATYFVGYGLMKEPVLNTHDNWCCITKKDASSTWQIPETWIANRNARRAALPDGMTIKRFTALSDAQSSRTNAIVRRLIIAPR